MFDIRCRIAPIIFAFAVVGCSEGTESIDLRVGLFVAGDDQLSTRLRYHTKSTKKGELRGLDRILESAITKACRRVFSSVHVLESEPTQEMADNEELDLIVIAKLMGVEALLVMRAPRYGIAENRTTRCPLNSPFTLKKWNKSLLLKRRVRVQPRALEFCLLLRRERSSNL